MPHQAARELQRCILSTRDQRRRDRIIRSRGASCAEIRAGGFVSVVAATPTRPSTLRIAPSHLLDMPHQRESYSILASPGNDDVRCDAAVCFTVMPLIF